MDIVNFTFEKKRKEKEKKNPKIRIYKHNNCIRLLPSRVYVVISTRGGVKRRI